MPPYAQLLVIVVAMLGFWAIVMRPARSQQKRVQQGGRGHPQDPASPSGCLEDETFVTCDPPACLSGAKVREESTLDELAVEPDIREATQQGVAGVGLGREEHLLADPKAEGVDHLRHSREAGPELD